jgi:hypothetical protein
MRIRPVTEADLSALSDLATRTWLDAFASSVSRQAAAAEVERTRSEAYFRSVQTLGFRTVGATRVTIGSEEVGDDLVMVLVR